MRTPNALWLAVALTLLAALIRLHRLDAVPLRGDEAFSVRVWAEPAEWGRLWDFEPHPSGVFVLFAVWKQTAGESELAMRALPLLVNLLGVAALMALARRLIGAKTAWLAGLLWAVNPFLVWHAQDVRNYALWAALSPLALWLFLRAVQKRRRVDWVLYGAASLAALYTFLLEPFFLLVQLAYLLRFGRSALRPALLTWASMGVLLLPWVVQVLNLAQHGYSGTAARVSLDTLLREFLPTLLFGEARLSLLGGVGLLVALALGLLYGSRRQAPTAFLLAAWLFLPLLLLTLVGTRMNVFLPRYAIATTPALILALLWVAALRKQRANPLPGLVTAVLVAVSLLSLYSYFYTDPPKAPDWRSLATFLAHRTTANDAIILANVDPAFGYYYRGAARDVPVSEVDNAADLLDSYAGIFVQVGDATATTSRFLQEQAQFIPPAISLVKQYRAYEPTPQEIQYPLDVTFGDVVKLRGYTLLGGDAYGITVLLYWEPLRRTEGEFVGFVHAFAAESPFPVAQDDHAPLHNNAPTTAWLVGDLLRDPFALDLPIGTYTLQVGMYAAVSGERLRVVGTEADSWTLD